MSWQQGAIQAGGTALGALIGGISAKKQQARNQVFEMIEADKNRRFQSEEAQKTRDWQEELSNTAYQRANADMRAAGLNPMMVYGGKGGMASVTPSGATASGSKAGGFNSIYDNSRIGEAVGQGLNAFWTAKMNKKALQEKDAQIANMKALNSKLKEETNLILLKQNTEITTADKNRAEEYKALTQEKQIQTIIEQYNIFKQKYRKEAQYFETKFNHDEKYYVFDAWLKRGKNIGDLAETTMRVVGKGWNAIKSMFKKDEAKEIELEMKREKLKELKKKNRR